MDLEDHDVEDSDLRLCLQVWGAGKGFFIENFQSSFKEHYCD